MNERYEIRRKIGHGGLGAVYHAYDNQLQRDVAIKRLFAPVDATGTANRDATRERMMREATALSRLNHPNIVSVYDVGFDEDGGYVVMELLNGETLTDTIAKGTLTLEDFHQVVVQTLEALIAAEAQDMMHRDLKPSNLMLIWLASGRFLLKVLDFGLAKVSAQPALQTIDQSNYILGSIYYMAPEQFERRELTFSTDLYSMGCIYYFCLTGKDPFTGRSMSGVMTAHLEHQVTPLHDVRRDLPKEICDWVMWLMRRDMTQRPQSAREALDSFPLVEHTSGGVRIDSERQFVVPAATAEVQPAPVSTARADAGPTPRVSASPASPRTGSTPPSQPAPSPPILVRHSPASPASRGKQMLVGWGMGIALVVIVSAVFLATRSRNLAGPGLSADSPAQVVTPGAGEEGGKDASLPPSPAITEPEPKRDFETLVLDDHFDTGAVLSIENDPEDPLDAKWSVGNLVSVDGGRALAIDAPRSTVGEFPNAYLSPEGDSLEATMQIKLEENAGPLRILLVNKMEHSRGYLVEIGAGLEVSTFEFMGKDAKNFSPSDAVPLPATSPRAPAEHLSLSEVRLLRLRFDRLQSTQLNLAVSAGLPGGKTFTASFCDAEELAVNFSKLGIQLPTAQGRMLLDDVQIRTIANRSAKVWIDARFDTGKSRGTHEVSWLGEAKILKPNIDGNGSLVNSTSACAVPVAQGVFAAWPSVTLTNREMLEASCACRLEGGVNRLRVTLVNKLEQSRGYLVEFGPGARIAIHEYSGADAQTFSLSSAPKIREAPAPSWSPPLLLSDLERVCITVARISATNQTKIQATATFAGGRALSTTFDDLDRGATSFSKLGLRTEGAGGRLLLDDVRVVSSTTPIAAPNQ